MTVSKADAALLNTVVGDWADENNSWYKVTRDENGTGDTCSVLIWRHTGEKIMRKGVICMRPAGRLPRRIAWGRETVEGTYYVDQASATTEYAYWVHTSNGRGFAWYRPHGGGQSSGRWGNSGKATSSWVKAEHADKQSGWASETWKEESNAAKGRKWTPAEPTWQTTASTWKGASKDSSKGSSKGSGNTSFKGGSGKASGKVSGKVSAKGFRKGASAKHDFHTPPASSPPSPSAGSPLSGVSAGAALLRSIGGRPAKETGSEAGAAILNLVKGGGHTDNSSAAAGSAPPVSAVPPTPAALGAVLAAARLSAATAQSSHAGSMPIPEVVVQGWSAAATDGLAPESQLLSVSAGDVVGVLWRQPAEKGGYWAFGECRGSAGYFPVSCLTGQDHVIRVKPASATAQDPRLAAMANAMAAHAAASYDAATRAIYGEWHIVHWPWKPTGANRESQLHLREGERVHVTWRTDEGFWAYGQTEHQPQRLGYFPLSCIMP